MRRRQWQELMLHAADTILALQASAVKIGETYGHPYPASCIEDERMTVAQLRNQAELPLGLAAQARAYAEARGWPCVSCAHCGQTMIIRPGVYPTATGTSAVTVRKNKVKKN